MPLTSVRVEHEGAVLQGQLAVPQGPGPHPGVLVMHNAHGLGPHMTQVAERLAALGFVALATDMYGGGAYHTDKDGAGRSLLPLWENPQLLRARVVHWYEHLESRSEVDPQRLAAIGYCFGGQCVLELARSGADVKAVVSYHGILKTHERARASGVNALVAVYTGVLDPYAPAEDVQALREEMTAAGARWHLTEFGDAYHAFTDTRLPTQASEGMAYNALADSVSWNGTLAILKSSFA